MPITDVPPRPEESLLAEIVDIMQRVSPELFSRWLLLERVDGDEGISNVWDELGIPGTVYIIDTVSISLLSGWNGQALPDRHSRGGASCHAARQSADAGILQ